MKLTITIIIVAITAITGLNAQPFSDLPAISESDKIFYLSKLWSEIDFSYPFFNELEGFNLDEVYLEYIDKVREAQSTYEYYRVLQRFAATLKDCNTRVVLPQAISSRLSYPLIMIAELDGKIIITNIGKRYVDEVPIGSRLLQIDNKPVNRYLDEEVAPYISASTDEILRQKSLLLSFVGMEGSTIPIRIEKPDGSIANARLTKNWRDDSWADFIWQKEIVLHDMLDDDIVYIEMNRFDDDMIHRLLENVFTNARQAKGLVIDLRENGFGVLDIAYDVMQHFTTIDQLPFPRIKSRKHIPLYRSLGTPSPWYGMQANPYYIAYGQKNEWITEDPVFFDNDPEKEKLLVPTVVLTGYKTTTPAEEMAMILQEHRDNVKIVGSNTSGRRGQAFIFHLPLMGQAWVSTSKDTYPDGRILSRKGVNPDVRAKQTYDDFLEEKDTVLETGIQVLKEMIE